MRGRAAIMVVVAVALLAWVDTLVAQDCPVEDFPFHGPWAGSGHADANSEAFRHWDDDVPPVVSSGCAKCHSTPGYLDYLGADGTAAGTVENEPNVGTTITCTACHNEVSIVMDSVTFPSGIEITDLGDEARCMQCHQGRQSTVSVDQRITDANVPDDDTVSGSLSFRNIHYLPAGATQLGAEAMGGYQYAGKSYDVRFAHVEGLDTCISCHDPHDLEVRVDLCTTCHVEVTTEDDLQDVRLKGSASDYDGDGNVAEGIADEITDLQVILYAAIQAYAADMGAPIVYDSHSY
ncbi:MAG: polyheme membrane-associated cytochrome C, partial [Planctomycetota bacterium]